MTQALNKILAQYRELGIFIKVVILEPGYPQSDIRYDFLIVDNNLPDTITTDLGISGKNKVFLSDCFDQLRQLYAEMRRVLKLIKADRNAS